MKDTFNPLFHFHPEYELIHFWKGGGKCIIGNKTTTYKNDSLFLLGPNLPHCFFNEKNEVNRAFVIQLNKKVFNGIIKLVPETGLIHTLMEKGRYGLKFSDHIGTVFHGGIKEMFNLDPFARLMKLLSILHGLSRTDDYELLSDPGYVPRVNLKDYDRINLVYQYVFNHFKGPIVLNDVSSLINMTDIAFCRYFKKITRRTFFTYLNEYRTGHACKLLSTTDTSISQIAFESGFESIGNFNKQFKKYMGTSPTSYRRIAGI